MCEILSDARMGCQMRARLNRVSDSLKKLISVITLNRLFRVFEQEAEIKSYAAKANLQLLFGESAAESR